MRNISQAHQLYLIISVSFFINKNVVIIYTEHTWSMDEITFNGLGKKFLQ